MVGDAIRAARKERGQTQGELAEAANLALETVSRVELGQTRPTLRTLTRLADALGVSVQSFFADPSAYPEGSPSSAKLLAKEAGLVGATTGQRKSPPLPADMRRLLAILPKLDSRAIRHILGIARLLLKAKPRGSEGASTLRRKSKGERGAEKRQRLSGSSRKTGKPAASKSPAHTAAKKTKRS